MSFWALIRKRLRSAMNPSRLQPEIKVCSNGFKVASSERDLEVIWEVSWDAIQRVEAFKRDLVTTDLICITVSNKRESIELNEEMAGWAEFIEEMENRLPIIAPRKEWYERVMKPAFAKNHEILFKNTLAQKRGISEESA